MDNKAYAKLAGRLDRQARAIARTGRTSASQVLFLQGVSRAVQSPENPNGLVLAPSLLHLPVQVRTEQDLGGDMGSFTKAVVPRTMEHALGRGIDLSREGAGNASGVDPGVMLSTAGHEAVHALDERAGEVRELLGEDVPRHSPSGLEPRQSGSALDAARSWDSGYGPTLHALMKQAETPEQTAQRLRSQTGFGVGQSAGNSSNPFYAAQAQELRARMHQIAMATQVPLNRHETFAMLEAVGVELPEHTRGLMQGAEGVAARAKYELDKPMAQRSIAARAPLMSTGGAEHEIRSVVNYFPPHLRPQVVERALPEIMGQVVEEIYGDAKGRKRFDPAQENPLGARRFAEGLILRKAELKHIDIERRAHRPGRRELDWDMLAQKVEPQYAGFLARHALGCDSTYPAQPEAFAALAKHHPDAIRQQRLAGPDGHTIVERAAATGDVATLQAMRSLEPELCDRLLAPHAAVQPKLAQSGQENVAAASAAEAAPAHTPSGFRRALSSVAHMLHVDRWGGSPRSSRREVSSSLSAAA